MIIGILETIFFKTDDLLEFLLLNGVLRQSRRCIASNCDGVQTLSIYAKNNKEFIMYRCEKRSCRKRSNITQSKINICIYLHTLYLILNGCTYQQIYSFHGLSKSTIMRIKNNIRELYEKYIMDRPVYLGGHGIVVEADETVLSRRGIIVSPTSTSDERRDTIWILGAIDNTDAKNFFIKRIENRKIESISEAFEGVIKVGSLLYTDGYRSYPQAAENLGLVHSIVNHSMGFISPDGIHTNNQEGFWAHLKASMRKEHGVKRVNIDRWISEYIFIRRYIVGDKREEIGLIFIDLLKYMFD